MFESKYIIVTSSDVCIRERIYDLVIFNTISVLRGFGESNSSLSLFVRNLQNTLTNIYFILFIYLFIHTFSEM